MSSPMVVSDIDGTLVHCEVGCGNHSLLAVEPGSAERPCFVSNSSLEIIQRLRTCLSVKFALVTGARSKTALARSLQLPLCDALATEEGGRIFMLDNLPSQHPTALPFSEDLHWRSLHSSHCGSPDESHLKHTDRSGCMWSLLSDPSLPTTGVDFDTREYSTCLRVKLSDKVSDSDRQRIIDRANEFGLLCSLNAGKLDVYPPHSGKANACRRIAANLIGCEEITFALGDDDNDVHMLKQASSKGLIVRRNANSVAQLCEGGDAFKFVAFDTEKSCPHCSTEASLQCIESEIFPR